MWQNCGAVSLICPTAMLCVLLCSCERLDFHFLYSALLKALLEDLRKDLCSFAAVDLIALVFWDCEKKCGEVLSVFSPPLFKEPSNCEQMPTPSLGRECGGNTMDLEVHTGTVGLEIGAPCLPLGGTLWINNTLESRGPNHFFWCLPEASSLSGEALLLATPNEPHYLSKIA